MESKQEGFQIKVKSLNDERFAVQVHEQMKVEELRAIIVELKGIPVSKQRLICRGKVMKDGHRLSEYKLRQDSTIHLVIRKETIDSSQSEPSLSEPSPMEPSQTEPSPMGNAQPFISMMGAINVPADQIPAGLSSILNSVLSGMGGQASEAHLDSLRKVRQHLNNSITAFQETGSVFPVLPELDESTSSFQQLFDLVNSVHEYLSSKLLQELSASTRTLSAPPQDDGHTAILPDRINSLGRAVSEAGAAISAIGVLLQSIRLNQENMPEFRRARHPTGAAPLSGLLGMVGNLINQTHSQPSPNTQRTPDQYPEQWSNIFSAIDQQLETPVSGPDQAPTRTQNIRESPSGSSTPATHPETAAWQIVFGTFIGSLSSQAMSGLVQGDLSFFDDDPTIQQRLAECIRTHMLQQQSIIQTAQTLARSLAQHLYANLDQLSENLRENTDLVTLVTRFVTFQLAQGLRIFTEPLPRGQILSSVIKEWACTIVGGLAETLDKVFRHTSSVYQLLNRIVDRHLSQEMTELLSLIRGPFQNAIGMFIVDSHRRYRERLERSPPSSDPVFRGFSEAERQQWMNTIEQDQTLQRQAQDQRPFSDSYRQGGTLAQKKQKVSAEEPADVRQGLKKQIRRAAEESGVDLEVAEDIPEVLVEAYRDQLLGDLSERINSDPDFSPDQFPHSAKLWNRNN